MEDTYRISDPRVLKAVSHPLRVRMLGLLRADGPATASELARTVGESSGSTSYHLRELAKFGFIEEDRSPDGRERRWRARHAYTSWNPLELSATPEGREVLGIMQARQLEALARVMEAYSAATWSPAWVEASGMGDYFVRLTPEGVKEFFERFEALKEELEQRFGDGPEAEPVHVFAAAYPRP